MDQGKAWLELAGEVLSQPDADGAQRLVAAALTSHTPAGLASRVTLSALDPEEISIEISGYFDAPQEQWPTAAEIRRHPLHAYFTDTGQRSPALMRDVVRAGWAIELDVMERMRDLRLSEEQLSVPLAEPGDPYDGWVLIAEQPFRPADVEQLATVRPLLVGIARHCRLLRATTAALSQDNGPRLTPRERVVLLLISQGRTAEGIAARLAISPRTVHKHQENLYRKLGAADRLSAVLAAQRRGLLMDA
ncbi:helix-turn-helix transcriptional regulator [Tessaracoccus sp. OS52]|uniref:helix-turn-helix transcriptional regulator n=1 Tax=Tessaracoccus sp. OS52 TaxID=2886691 RepID=UPI001D10F82C|nr:helix-turn-helix transcriptional regulator [Tessaracoccus sp. OS52]MCC2591955.1 helix-turn-helix transcriptional regulator [Tessaracoccus sp. OS52]